MGNSSSHEGEEDEALLDPFDGADTLGYRVLGVQPNSPASKAGLVSFLDFLVGANGEMLLASGENVAHGEEYPDVDLPALLEENKGKNVEFLVWNMKSQQERLVDLVPDDQWGGAGLLGVTIRLDNYAGAEERLVRVLEVDSPQSPAALAGLQPFNDYILGTTSETLQDTNQLCAILEENVDRVVELYVYNSQSDLVRTVALMPTLSWGGPGLLGAAVGTGYLHRFPSKVQDTTGASVERKVRYLGPKTSTSRSSGAAAAAAADSAASVAKMAAQAEGLAAGQTLELEPQLEMEAPEEEEEQEQQGQQQRRQQQQQQAAAPSFEQPIPQQETASHSHREQETMQQQLPPQDAGKEEPTWSLLKPAQAPVDAAALFAGPPRNTSVKS